MHTQEARQNSYLFKFIRYSVMFHCLDLLSQLKSRYKEKKGTNIVLHSLLIPLNFALSEKRKLSTMWIFAVQKTKEKVNKKKRKKNSNFFFKCLLWLQDRKQYFWTPIVSNPSPHSHTLAGITGNATDLDVTQPVLIYKGDGGDALLIVRHWVEPVTPHL